MIMRVRGVQKLDFVSNDGKRVEGCNLFLSHADEHVVGERVTKVFVNASVELPKDVKIGDEVNISFTNKGRVEGISKIQ